MKAPSIARVSKIKPTRPKPQAGPSINGDASEWRNAVLSGKTLDEINALRERAGLKPAREGEYRFEPDEHGVYRYAPPIPKANGDHRAGAFQNLPSQFPEHANLEIDPDFEALSLPATEEEWKLLDESLAVTGQCRDPVLVWPAPDGREIVLDGHRRITLCAKRGYKFFTSKIHFPSREAALEWTRDEQLARRNLTEAQKSYLRGKAYLAQKKEVGRGEKKRKVAETQSRKADLPSSSSAPLRLGDSALKNGNGASVSPLPTAEKIARETGVSARTVKRDAKFAEAVEQLPTERKAAVLSGKVAKSAVVAPAKTKRKGAEAQSRKEGKPAKSPTAWRMAWLRELVTAALAKDECVEACARAVCPALDAHWERLAPSRRREYLLLLSDAELREVAKRGDVWVPATATTKAKIINLILLKEERGLPKLPPGMEYARAKNGR